MFKKIQKNLLLRHPLLWNIKFVPVLAVTLTINIIFFLFGYIYGGIDFSSLYEDSYNQVSGIVMFFGVVIAILTLVLWLVFYFRNNAFKSFYPKGKNQLYKEWLLILIICLLNCNYQHCFEYAYKLRARNYFSEEEALKRIDIISRASIFTEGSYYPVDQFETDRTKIQITNNYYNNYDEINEYAVAVDSAAVYTNDSIVKDSVCYYGNLYHQYSFINKNTLSFILQDHARDSVNEFKVKGWMYNQQKDSIKKVLDNFLNLAKDHQLKANITSDEWMDIVYHPKQYVTKKEVGKDSLNPITSDNYNGIRDSINNTVKIINHSYVAFPKYHVPLTQLRLSYDRISQAWSHPYDIDAIAIIMYFGFSLSLLIFSFRVTLGKSWLIAAVALGISGLITFIFTMIARYAFEVRIGEDTLFISIWFIIISVIGIWFTRIYLRKQSKKLSLILVNLLLWLLPAVLPIIWFMVYGYVRYSRYTYDYYGPDDYDYTYYVQNDPRYPIYTWMEANTILMIFVNLLIITLYMYFFTKVIRKWKGIAEA